MALASSQGPSFTKKALLIIFLFAFLTEPLYAESYLVYEAFPPVVWLTGKPRHCCSRHRCYKRHKIVHKKHYRKVRSCYRRSRLRMSVTYVFPLVAPCAPCQTSFVQGGCNGCGPVVASDPYYDINYDVMVPRSTMVYYDNDLWYNPDLATADDDPMFDPELNIDR